MAVTMADCWAASWVVYLAGSLVVPTAVRKADYWAGYSAGCWAVHSVLPMVEHLVDSMAVLMAVPMAEHLVDYLADSKAAYSAVL